MSRYFSPSFFKEAAGIMTDLKKKAGFQTEGHTGTIIFTAVSLIHQP